MKIYKLSPRFIRRLRSIVLYGDYPTNDECLTYWDEFTSKKNAKSKSKKSSKRDEFVDYLVQNKNGFEGLFPEVHENYITIRIFSDTSLNFLKMPGYRKMLGGLQEQLADYRTTQREKQKNLERDVYLYALHKILHFDPSEANETLKEYGVEPLVGDPDDIEKTVYNATRVVEERALDIQKSNKSRPSKRQILFQNLLKQVLATIKSEQK
jgi:hypothetical protein